MKEKEFSGTNLWKVNHYLECNLLQLQNSRRGGGFAKSKSIISELSQFAITSSVLWEKNLVQTGAVADPFWRGPTDPPTRWAPQTPLQVGPTDPLTGGLHRPPCRWAPQTPLQMGPKDPLQVGPKDPLQVGPKDPIADGPQRPFQSGPHRPLIDGPHRPPFSCPF